MISLFFSIHLFGCFLLLFLSSLAQAATGECSIPPLYLPWRNITVSLDGLAVTRGIELGIGTPSQIFSLRPATTLNNTRISNVLECVSLTNITCSGAAGGVFDATKSSTYEVSIRSAWNGSQADQETATGSYVYFNDVLKFERNGSVLGFPLVNAGLEGGSSLFSYHFTLSNSSDQIPFYQTSQVRSQATRSDNLNEQKPTTASPSASTPHFSKPQQTVSSPHQAPGPSGPAPAPSPPSTAPS